MTQPPNAPPLQAKKSALKRLLKQRLAQGLADPEEVSALLDEVQQARTTDDLAAMSQRLLRVVGARTRGERTRNRRQAPRATCSLMLRVLEDGSHGMHFIRDIGTGGVSVYMQAALPLFPILHCQIPLYHLNVVHSFTARVVWCQPEPPRIVGLQYVDVGDEVLAWVRSLPSSLDTA